MRFTLAAPLLLLSACASAPPPAPSPPRPIAPAPIVSAPRPPGPEPRAALPARLGDWIDAYVASYGASWGEAYSFSGQILVTRDGVPVFSRGYGHTQRPSGAVPDAETRFRIGSVTKEVTAVAVLQLVDEGLVREDDPIGTYVAGLPFGDRVTLRHLLSHTSGVADFTLNAALRAASGEPHTHAEVVASFANVPLAFEPGTQFNYSSSNYFLLGMVIEKVTGQSYEAWLHEHVFAPAGMTRTSTVDDPNAPDTATGYETVKEDLTVAPPIDMSVPFAAGGLRSTANDLVKWDRALARGILLTPEAERRRVTPVKDDYAYGVAISKVAGRTVEEHGGEINGFQSGFARVPSEGLAVVLLSNHENVASSEILDAILEMTLTGKRVPPKVEVPVVPMDAAAIARVVGDYAVDPASEKPYAGKVPDEVIAPFRRISFTAEGSHLIVHNRLGTLAIFQREGGDLFTKRFAITVHPEPSKGRLETFVLAQGGKLPLRYIRAKAGGAAEAPRR